CELLHQMFLNHFRVKGFRVKEPPVRLMIALFDSPDGFEAYLGVPMPEMVTGVYDPPSNRLVVYDFGRNRALVRDRKAGERFAQPLHWACAGQYVRGTLELRAGQLRADLNLSTIMHEAAHQLSFNTGLLNRHGDCPVWLAEGLATYCEATEQGSWQGIGAPN